MIQICKDEAMIINYREHDNSDAFIVFMIPGQRFLKGLLKAERREYTGDLRRFYWARIEFVWSDDEDALLEIIYLEMGEPVKESPPAF